MIDFLNSIDTAIFLFINSFFFSWLNPVMVKVSGQLIWMPVIACALYLGFKEFGKRNVLIFALFILLAIISADITSSQIMKNIFARLRPCRQDDLINLINHFGQKCGGRYGFVSSHASNTFAATIFIINTLKVSRRTKIIALFFPVLVSYSRIYLGVHFPGDIIGGTSVGIFWGLMFAWAFKNIQGASLDNSQL